MLILSIVLARNNSTLLLSGLIFAVLLCFKHIYMYLAPAYFVYLLRAYCLAQRSSFPYFSIRFFNCVKLGLGIIAVFASAFGPFALWSQLEQVFRRLFPFSRGLCHAYWAPNVWAMYSFCDRVLIYCTYSIRLPDSTDCKSGTASWTSHEQGSSKQRYSGARWRLCFRCASQHSSTDMFCPYPGCSNSKYAAKGMTGPTNQ